MTREMILAQCQEYVRLSGWQKFYAHRALVLKRIQQELARQKAK